MAARVRRGLEQKESGIDQACRRVVEKAGGKWIKLHTETDSGMPDRLLAFHGATVVEMKKPGGRVTPLQRQRHTELRALGVRVEVFRSVTELKALLTELQGPELTTGKGLF